jgi:hypothetical protein
MLSAVGTLLICNLLAAAPQSAARPLSVPPRIEAFLNLCETSRRGAIAQLEFTLRGLRAETVKSPDSSRRIAEIEENLRVLRANRQPVVPTFYYPPDIGAIGRLPKISGHVDQILSDREMLVRCFFPVRVTTVKDYERQSELIERPVTFLIRGMPTRDMQEGGDIELSQVFEIVGRRGYRTADGRATEALVISQFDMKAIEPYFRRTTVAAKR